MAYYYANRINSFAEAEIRYNTVKPYGGRVKGKDVRPLGERRQYYERIEKINDDCYLLLDWGYADDKCNTRVPYAPTDGRIVTVEEKINLAPIVWQRHPDGTETVKVRNATDSGQAYARYKFLEHYLPRGLNFYVGRNADHVLTITHPPKTYTKTRFYLNLSKTVPQQVYASIQAHVAAGNNPYGFYKLVTAEDDGVAITFQRHTDGTFTYLSGGTPREVARTRVDKAVKGQFKEHLTRMFQFCLTMAPLLPLRDSDYANRMRNEAKDWCASVGRSVGYYWGNPVRVINDAETLRQIVTDPDHPMYLHIAYSFVATEMGAYPEDDDARKECQARFNRWVNRECGFTFKTTVVAEEAA